MTIYTRNRVTSRNVARLRPTARSPSADELAEVIAACADKLAGSFPETATLLEIARLDLVARLHGISDEEMQQVACCGLTAAE